VARPRRPQRRVDPRKLLRAFDQVSPAAGHDHTAVYAATGAIPVAIWRATMAASSPIPINSDDFALAQEMDADEEQPGDERAGAVALGREAELVEGARKADPAVIVGAKPAGEDDGAEAGQVELLGCVGAKRRWLGDLRIGQAAFGHERADAVHEHGVDLIAPSDGLAQIRRKPGTASVRAEESDAVAQDLQDPKVTEQRDPHLLQRAVVQVVAAAASGRLHVREQPQRRMRQRADRRLVEPGLERPRHDVAIADPPWHPRRPPAREEDLTARLVKVLGDLTTRLAAADHENAPGRKRRGIAVLLDVDLQQVRGQRGRAGRPVRTLVGAGGHDHVARRDRPGRRLQIKPAGRPAPQRGDLDACAHRRLEARRVALEIRDDVVASHEAVGIVAVVVVAGQPDDPVGRHEAEAVPPPPPRLADPALLQHDVRDAGLRELVTDRQPGLTPIDDHHVELFCHRTSKPNADNRWLPSVTERKQVRGLTPMRTRR
jgi:hypothetical protein